MSKHWRVNISFFFFYILWWNTTHVNHHHLKVNFVNYEFIYLLFYIHRNNKMEYTCTSRYSYSILHNKGVNGLNPHSVNQHTCSRANSEQCLELWLLWGYKVLHHIHNTLVLCTELLLQLIKDIVLDPNFHE